MPLKSFDHVNIWTTKLDEMVAWYQDILGLEPGPRPNFSVGGAWLYLGDAPLVHLVVSDTPREVGANAALEHFAFSATNMAAFLAILDSRSIPYSIDPVPGFPIVQVNFRDPEGIHIHVDFDKAEMP